MPRSKATANGRRVISRTDAIEITREFFPNGPETLARHLKVDVQRSPMEGVEGWCIVGPLTRIRVNARSHETRQRFTLAHELAHLVLGTQPDIATEPFRSNQQEERDADALASEFLVPADQLERYFAGHLPVDARSLTRLAKAANVSPVMAACRVVNATELLGIKNSAVVFFRDGCEEWRYSHGLRFDEDEAAKLLARATESAPDIVRVDNEDGHIVVGSLIETAWYQVLLVQLLPEDDASGESPEERLRRLQREVFQSDYGFQQSVAAVFGSVKNKCNGMSLDDAIAFFGEHYLGSKYRGQHEKALRSDAGQQLTRIHLSRWFD